MPLVTCPTCGEKGKIGLSLVGTRIKCTKCGASFQVLPPAAKGVAAAPHVAPRGEAPSGIEVEGLDPSAWSAAPETPGALIAHAVAEPVASSESIPTTHSAAASFEYKLLTPRDKFFDGRFDLARLEEALNHYGRQGWTVKAMSTPHVKGFSGVMEECLVVVLER